MVNFIDALAEYIRIIGQVIPEVAEYPKLPIMTNNFGILLI
jgi:hypothetical protein